MPEGIDLIDAIDMDYPKFFDGLNPEDEVSLVGGDGTLHCFVNDMKGYDIKNNVYLYAAGTGNDFIRDLGGKAGDEVLINDYLKDLPLVKVNGEERYFVDNMSYGIDGYVCEVADEQRKKNPKVKVSYAMIALKGLLGKFKPCCAEVTVDGVKKEYEHVWFAPTMKGRFVGGGMLMAPEQDRRSGKLTVVVFHMKSRLGALLRFPTIFSGTHVNYPKYVDVITGNNIKVKFSRPCAAQVDGETILNVHEYAVEM